MQNRRDFLSYFRAVPAALAAVASPEALRAAPEASEAFAKHLKAASDAIDKLVCEDGSRWFLMMGGGPEEKSRFFKLERFDRVKVEARGLSYEEEEIRTVSEFYAIKHCPMMGKPRSV